jgi:outer membrane protein assembly factor BamB
MTSRTNTGTDDSLHAINVAVGTDAWQVETGDAIYSTSAVSLDSKTVYVASHDFYIYAINAA